MVKGKEIIVKSLNGLYILETGHGVYRLTDRAHCTSFATMKEVRAAIAYCQSHVKIGKYTYITL